MSGASRTSQPAATTAWNTRHKAALQTNNDFVVKNRKGDVKPREYNVYINKAYNLKQDKNGTKDEIPASDIIKYESEKGGNTADYYNVYDTDDRGNLSLVDSVRIKRGEGGANLFRIRKDAKGTIGVYNIPGKGKDKDVLGVTIENSEARNSPRIPIPTSNYHLIKSDERPGAKKENLTHPKRYVLYNDKVHMGRGIAGHGGNFYDEGNGCIMFGEAFGLAKKREYKVNAKRVGTLRTYNSVTNLEKFESAVEQVGVKKFTVKVHNYVRGDRKIKQ